MIPYGHQSISEADIREVIKALRSEYLTQGPRVKEFEKALARYAGAKYAVAVSNGTAALHLAYLTAGIGAGDEAITTPITFAATSNMLIAVGAKPVFCDIREDTYNIDENKIEKLITKRTKAIVPVHMAGQSCEMDKIWKLAKKHGLTVIEDACHALGAKYRKSRIGSCKYSDMAVFSFHPVKSITTGEGGAILTNSEKQYKKLLLLRSHGIAKDKKGFNVMTELGYNYRLTDIQAALGLSQLKRLDSFTDKRHEVASWYKKELSGLDKVVLPAEKKGNYSAWHLYLIRVKNKKDRLHLYKHLQKKGIGINFHYPCVYKHPFYRKKYGKASYRIAEKYAAQAITIPLYPGLTKKQVNFISNSIKEYFNQ